jgi:hypothetical protein
MSIKIIYYRTSELNNFEDPPGYFNGEINYDGRRAYNNILISKQIEHPGPRNSREN